MTNNEKALNYINQLELHGNVRKDFMNGVVNASELMGILYWANDDETEMIAKLQKNGDVVWHIIRGTYDFGEGERCRMVAYLLATEDGDDELYCDGQYTYVLAYVDNLDWEGCSEYGEICITPVNGGLMRIV